MQPKEYNYDDKVDYCMRSITSYDLIRTKTEGKKSYIDEN